MVFSSKYCVAAVTAAMLVALLLRWPDLPVRPMHGDEAVGAVKFGRLLEANYYRYDPGQYHGPTLNYFTLVPAWLSGARDFTDVTETTLRSVPVFFGTALVVASLLLSPGLGTVSTVWAAVFCAVSTAFVFYSRFYIHEILLVFFCFGVMACAWRYFRSGRLVWVVASGLCAGLAYASKETSLIAFAAMAVALAGTMAVRKPVEKTAPCNWVRIARHTALGVATAAVISALFYSSFFSHPAGVVDSVGFAGNYIDRGVRGDDIHAFPWYYYLKMLLFWRLVPGIAWSEAIILLLAVAGFFAAFYDVPDSRVDRNLARFLALYTGIMVVAYAVIPYKTPWCMLGFLHGMTLLAGIGVSAVVRALRRPLLKMTAITVMVLAAGHLAYQAYLASYRYYDDPVNPYVYAHTSHDIFTIVRRIEQLAQAGPAGYNTYMQVICPGDDYWPLPWYLRAYRLVSWQSHIDSDLPIAPLIIASPDMEAGLMEKLYSRHLPGRRSLYVPAFDGYMELRPEVELRGYVTHSLWESYLRGPPLSVESITAP